MGILTYAKFIAGAAGLAVVAWGAATVNGWRVEAKASRPIIVIQAEKIVDQDRQLRGYESVVKDLKARDAIKEQVIVTVRERGEDLARRLTALNADLTRLEAERVAWQARPYVGTCDEMVREFARRGGAKP
jgi:hypothetical protein